VSGGKVEDVVDGADVVPGVLVDAVVLGAVVLDAADAVLLVLVAGDFEPEPHAEAVSAATATTARAPARVG
jgi:hypothetical protein